MFELLRRSPRAWRWETCREVLEREAAERRDFRGRDAAWSVKYVALCLSHTSVKHSPSQGTLLQREFVAVRRVHLHPSIAAILRGNDLEAERHPWLDADDITWVKAGPRRWTGTGKPCGNVVLIGG